MIGAWNLRGGLVLLTLGLLGGLAMSLYAFQPVVRPPDSLDRYDDLPRRLLRLAHIAAIMLQLLNVVFGLVIDRLNLRDRTRRLVSGILLASAGALPLALVMEALCAPIRALHLPGIPAVAFTLAVSCLAVSACRTDFTPRRKEEQKAWRDSSARRPDSAGKARASLPRCGAPGKAWGSGPASSR